MTARPLFFCARVFLPGDVSSSSSSSSSSANRTDLGVDARRDPALVSTGVRDVDANRWDFCRDLRVARGSSSLSDATVLGGIRPPGGSSSESLGSGMDTTRRLLDAIWGAGATDGLLPSPARSE
jgi:hypothetical protein